MRQPLYLALLLRWFTAGICPYVVFVFALDVSTEEWLHGIHEFSL